MSGLTDLHRHLDGSLRIRTLAELAGRANRTIPFDLRFFPGMGLQEALARFSFTLSVLQTPDAVERVAREICEDALADGVEVLEIRFAPQLHHEQPPEAYVDAALAGVDGRAGIILCGLYGEDPAILQSHVDIAATRPGVVAIDLAGGPTPGHDFRLDDYSKPFERARDLGINRTVHASEGRAPHEIRTAIEVLHAQRIGHGTTLLDDPAVLDLVLSSGVTIEACPTSNWQVGIIDTIGAHPIPRWLDAGVRVCINTDNTLLSDVSASEEYARVGKIEGMTPDKLEAARRFGHEAAFRR